MRKPKSRDQGRTAVRRPGDQTQKLLKAETTALRKFCEEHPSPRTLMLALLCRYEEFDQLVSTDICSTNYLECDFTRFRSDYQATAMLSKSPTLPTSYDRESEAIKDFVRYEAQCEQTNERLDAYTEGRLTPLYQQVHTAIHHCREHLLMILGSRPSRDDLAYCEESMRFGPGSTTSLTGVVTSGAKYSARQLDVTPRLSGFGTSLIPHLWARDVKYELNFRSSSKFTTVPKNAKKDRGICIEPDLNVYVQLGIGALLRRRLKHTYLDLNKGAEWNRYLAKKALCLGLATLDMKAASDTVSRSAVWLLFPNDWVELLHLARVDQTVLKGKTIDLHKWSSMGNGYTFELETLLFYGVLNGCLKTLGLGNEHVATFGDDMIMPIEAYELATRTLSFLGFSVNSEKSFSTGLFRESCGKDFFDSRDVRPIYFKGQKSNDEEIDPVQTLYHYANSLRAWSLGSHYDNRPTSPNCSVKCLPSWLSLISAIPAHLRFKVPHGTASTTGIWSNWDEAQPHVSANIKLPRNETWAGSHYREYFRPMVLDTAHYHGSYVATLAGQASTASMGQTMRGRFKTATTRWAYALAWPNLGAWN